MISSCSMTANANFRLLQLALASVGTILVICVGESRHSRTVGVVFENEWETLHFGVELAILEIKVIKT